MAPAFVVIPAAGPRSFGIVVPRLTRFLGVVLAGSAAFGEDVRQAFPQSAAFPPPVIDPRLDIEAGHDVGHQFVGGKLGEPGNPIAEALSQARLRGLQEECPQGIPGDRLGLGIQHLRHFQLKKARVGTVPAFTRLDLAPFPIPSGLAAIAAFGTIVAPAAIMVVAVPISSVPMTVPMAVTVVVFATAVSSAPAIVHAGDLLAVSEIADPRTAPLALECPSAFRISARHHRHRYMDQQREYIFCPLCGGTSHRLIYDLRSMDAAGAVPGCVMRCSFCSMWFKVLAPGVEIPTEYPGESGDDEFARNYLLGDAARALFRGLLTHLRPRPDGYRRRLLDIGSGQGALPEEAARLGFEAEGIDHAPSNVRLARARGINVTQATAEDLAADREFDVVAMVDSIEHLRDPLRVLRAVHRGLKPGGELIVYTPNHRAAVVLLARLLYAGGIRHPVEQIFGRNHLCFFDDRSLPSMLRRAGFELTSLRLLPYDPARPGQEVSGAALAVVRLVETLGRPLGRVFRMIAYADKPTGPDSNRCGA